MKNWNKKERFLVELLLILLVGICTSVLLIKSDFDGKLFKLIMLGLAGSAGLLMLPHRQKILLSSFVFLLPLEINKNFFRESIWYGRRIDAFVIWGYDVPFFLLVLFWLYQLSSDYTLRVYLFPHITIPFILILLFAFTGLYMTDVTLPIRISVLWLVVKSWLIVLYIGNNVKDKETIYLLVGVILLTGLFQALIGIGQFVTKGPLGLGFMGELGGLKSGQADISRVGGTIGHANKMALFLGMVIQLNMGYFFSRLPETSRNLRWMYIIPLAPMMLTLLLTYSRGGWFSFLTGGLINCYWCLFLRTGKKILSAIVVFGCFASFGLTIFSLVPSVRNRLLLDDGGAADIRKPTAQISHNIIRHHPFLGVGLNNYESVIHKYDNTDIWASYHFPAAVHNEFLLIAAEMGIPALLCFIYILGYSFITLWEVVYVRSDILIPYLAVGFFCGFISWIMHNQKEYQYVFFTGRFWLNIGLLLSMKMIIINQREKVCSARLSFTGKSFYD
ncbi:O-Antigen ligase [Candidatus Electrothrix gigas]